MAKNWNVSKIFKPSDLSLFFIIFLLVGAWFVWANTYDPSPETSEYRNIEVQNGEFWSTSRDLRITATLQISFETLPQQDIYLVLNADGRIFNDERIINQENYRYFNSQIVTSQIIDKEIEAPGEWQIMFYAFNSTSENISFDLTTDNPPFSEDQRYPLVIVLMWMVMILNIVIHWKKIRYFRLWIKARRQGKSFIFDQEVNTEFGHEEAVKSFEENTSNEEKMDSMFERKSKE